METAKWAPGQVMSALAQPAGYTSLALAAAFAALAASRPWPWSRSAWAKASALVSGVAVAIMLPGSILGAPTFGMMPLANIDDLSGFIRRNTPAQAILLVPPDVPQFRLRAERALVGDLDAPAFNKVFFKEWAQRMADLTNHYPLPEEARAGWLSLSSDQLIAVGCKYSANYLVVEAYREIDLPRLYANSQFALYRLPCGR